MAKNQGCACKCQNPHLGILIQTNLWHEKFKFIVYFTMYSCNYHYLKYILNKKTHLLEQTKQTVKQKYTKLLVKSGIIES